MSTSVDRPLDGRVVPDDAALPGAGPTASPGPEPEERAAHLGWIFSSLMLVMLLGALDQTIVSTALPTIVGDLHGLEHMAWVTTAYILAATMVMPIYGKMGDLFGRKTLFMAGIVLFLAGSALCGFAQGVVELSLFRFVQGLGGGGLMIMSQTIIADVVPMKDRAKFMAPIGAVFGFSSVVGPLVGGWLTDGPGWRWAFWINLPLGLVSLVVLASTVHLSKRRNDQPIDYPGIAFMAAAVTCLVLATSWGGTTYAWSSPVIAGLIAGTLVCGTAFWAVERRAAEPLIPLRLFGNRAFTLTTLIGLASGVGMFACVGYLPTYLQMVYGLSATDSGLLLIPMVAGIITSVTWSGRRISAGGRFKPFAVGGSVVTGLAVLLISTLQVDQPVWVVCCYVALLGFGVGLSMQVLVMVVQNAVDPREIGTATSSNNFFREIGATVGIAVVGAVFTSSLTARLTAVLGASGGAGPSANGLTPALVRSMPAPVRDSVIAAYADSLTPILGWLVPLFAVATVLGLLLEEVPLVDRGPAAH